jgi:Predicted ATPase
VELARCIDYAYFSQTCQTWGDNIDQLDIDRPDTTVTVDVPGFSAYTLYFPSQDNQDNQSAEDDGGSGGGGTTTGGSGGGFAAPVSNNDSDDESTDVESQGVEIGVDDITVSLQPGDEFETSIGVTNRFEENLGFNIDPSSSVSQFMDVPSRVDVSAGETETVSIDVSADSEEQPGSYSGNLVISSSENRDSIPVNIDILPSSGESLEVGLEILTQSIAPNGTLRMQTDISNQVYQDDVEVDLNFQLYNTENGTVMQVMNETVEAGTSTSEIFEMNIPENIDTGSYEVRVNAEYRNIQTASISSDVDSFQVETSLWSQSLLGFTVTQWILGSVVTIFLSLAGYAGYRYRQKLIRAKKRYLEDIDLDTIPGGGYRRGYLGKLAEVGEKTYFKIDDLKVHAIIAGATGSGKTVTGQGMVEEVLEEGVNVIVLDPTAQWSGYLSECEDDGMLELYSEFGISGSDAREFKGNIRAIEPEQEEIDITPYLETDEDQDEGEIIVFSMHKLNNENIDKFVDTTIQQVFDANLPEREQLESLIVYDEAHRLLEKFGGSGTGVNQLERGAREFRKYGVGMILLSQVVSDFPEEVRANVGTTIQMRTQDEGDLERVRNKFGKDTVKSIAKAEIGSGMLQNSEYNHGRPYFVNFRPLRHSPHRLSDEELEKYEDYNRKIDEIEHKVEQLDSEEQTYEFRTQLNLAKKNLRSGSFNLVDIYLDELEDSLE